jgi:imidazolonepropionase-like amidohydrolase
MLRSRAVLVPFVVAVLAAVPAPTAERSPGVQPFVAVDAPVVALTHVRVIDGTGADARADQTIVIEGGRITALGPAAPIPSGAKVLDLSGRTVFPGLVMLHEHLFYPAGENAYNQQEISFPRLYLAGGVTTMRTGGTLEPWTDLNIKKAIDAGERPGPALHVTGPYIEGPGLPILSVKALRDVADARRMVEYWSGEGATSFKTYMHVSRADLGAVIEEAHARGHKVTGHLCSVTFREAAALGIDNLEHGFVVSTDFVKDKKPDTCPPGKDTTASLLALDPQGREALELIDALIAAKVALTSTLPVFETLVPGRPPAPDRALNVLLPEVRDQYLRIRSRIAVDKDSPWSRLFEKEMALERTFSARGGLLVSGTDPTGYGGVVPGFSNQRQLELLVEAGFTPLEAIRIGTANGARYLGVDDRVGTLAVGKQADLVVVKGDPSRAIADVANVEIVFRQGLGYDPARLVDSVKGVSGLR